MIYFWIWKHLFLQDYLWWRHFWNQRIEILGFLCISLFECKNIFWDVFLFCLWQNSAELKVLKGEISIVVTLDDQRVVPEKSLELKSDRKGFFCHYTQLRQKIKLKTQANKWITWIKTFIKVKEIPFLLFLSYREFLIHKRFEEVLPFNTRWRH